MKTPLHPVLFGDCDDSVVDLLGINVIFSHKKRQA